MVSKICGYFRKVHKKLVNKYKFAFPKHYPENKLTFDKNKRKLNINVLAG